MLADATALEITWVSYKGEAAVEAPSGCTTAEAEMAKSWMFAKVTLTRRLRPLSLKGCQDCKREHSLQHIAFIVVHKCCFSPLRQVERHQPYETLSTQSACSQELLPVEQFQTR